MSLRLVLAILGLAVLAGIGWWLYAGGPADPAPKPSLLLVVLDTLRADRLGLYGYTGGTSPVLDSLAERSIVYEQAIAPAPFTMPSMASLFTGLYPDRTGVNNHDFRNPLHLCKSPTLAELAQRAGYRTEAVVTNGWLSDKKMGFDRGFDGFRGQLQPAGRTTDQALDLLESFGDDPFLLWVHYIDQHMPYRPPPAVAHRFGVDSGTSEVIDDFVSKRVEPQEIYFFGNYPAGELEATRRLYDATVAHVDRQIGRLLDALERSGRAEDTIVIVLSDHGESLGDHGLFFAHDFTLYEELIRVVLMVARPGMDPSRIRQQVSLVDVLPSLCSWMGLDCPAALDGRTLPALEPEPGERRTVFAAGAPHRERYDRNPRLHVEGIDGRWTMARNGNAKLIKIPHPDGARWEIYDLGADPAETRILSAHADAEALRTALQEWETSVRKSRPAPLSAEPTLDPETMEHLRSLGYVE